MYYEQLFQTNEAKMNFVKGLIRISKADGGISPEEQTFFIDAARGLGISEEDIAMLPAVMNQDAEIPLAFASRSEVLCFLREALQLCMVDDEYAQYDKEVMYWAGYLYRYWHILTKESSKEIYAQAPAKTMNTNYLMFHTMAPELAIEDLKELHQQKKHSKNKKRENQNKK